MLPCPCCKKPVAETARECPSCRADLSLLSDYVVGITGSLVRAEQMTREGRLAEAVWAYLDILDIDPENSEARRQVGRVATAVRAFDSRPRHASTQSGWGVAIWVVIVLGALILSFLAGMRTEQWVAYRATHDTQKIDNAE